ncbi:ribbon-helix-helix domain-containing protein [Herbaspirillum huttiense]|uniref:Ribbon-helix-helix domain-containing protein n=2 Tax=Herbaspirillum huttiense TaxID=863372 RepID=A0AAJ2HC02_9BURK|nr:ribbon-helix-helix domain-containing protein [Herbaspirillum huttiense]MDR9837686.1 ribbon-helix-helix domain-containing protein [Herbaspirillum huttiense]UWE16661.1 ribbon-helix-helix domain-containing protein [Herbaspirillum huttiense]
MSRILVDLPESQLADLTQLVESQRRPRAVIIREAIAAYITQHKLEHDTDVFGLWKKKKVDGLAYQRELRSEW